ncbi:MAG: hypothetical protein QOG91_542 [Candidatus Parcubacteria bacterium]|jgi:CheY-like chemotaxis protein|nr:hypothetical protein [Candidatus Parcubacteria bacterium]
MSKNRKYPTERILTPANSRANVKIERRAKKCLRLYKPIRIFHMSRLRILLVDNDQASLDGLIKICQSLFGCEVIIARDRRSADQAITLQEFQVIVWGRSFQNETLQIIENARTRFPRALQIAAAPEKVDREAQKKAGCMLDANPVNLFDVLGKALASYGD